MLTLQDITFGTKLVIQIDSSYWMHSASMACEELFSDEKLGIWPELDHSVYC